MRPTSTDAPLLAFDTGSPVTTIAVGRGTTVLAERSLPLRQTSERLLASAEDALHEAGTDWASLGGVVVLRGPGSFTGLRVGLATAMGLHQARGYATAVIDTSTALAAAAPHEAGSRNGLVVTAVDAMRGEWHVRRFTSGLPPQPTDEGERVAAPAFADLPPCHLVGVSLDAQPWTADLPANVVVLEPPPAARLGLALADRLDDVWNPARLMEPIYFRPPAVTLPSTSAAASQPRAK